ncbi:MAG: DUF4738 domain-containing protein [Marinifilaceae bacterium]
MRRTIIILIIAFTVISCEYISKNKKVKKNIVETICSSTKDTNLKVLAKKDTLENWFPKKMEKIISDTVFNQDNNNFNIEITYYSLENSFVTSDYEGNDCYYIYHYRNNAVDIKVKINNDIEINKTVIKEDFKEYLGEDLPTIGVLFHFNFTKVVKDEIIFKVVVIKPDSDYLIATKYFVKFNGDTRFEPFPEEYYNEI